MFGRFGRFSWEKQGTRRLVTSALILSILAIALAFRELTPFVFDGFVVILVWFACYEVMNVKKADDKGVRDYYMYPFIAIAYLTFLLGILLDNPFPFWLHVVLQIVIVFVLCIYVYLMSYTDKAFAKECLLRKKKIGRECWRVVLEYLKLILYPAFLLFTLVPLNHLARWAEVVPYGATESVPVGGLALFALLMVFVVSMFTDTFAYVVGSLLKGRQLAPKISKGKTISGTIGGLFGGVIGALLVIMIMSIGVPLQTYLTEKIGYATAVIIFVSLMGLVGSIVTQAGDLYASWIKRRGGVKDFGKWLPGHGGLMDRIDGIIWNSAFVFLVMMVLVFLV